MKRFATVLFAFAVVVATGSAAHASLPWIAPQTLVTAVGDHGVVLMPTNRTFSSYDDGTHYDGDRLPGQVLQFSSLAAFKAEAETIPDGTIVMYDIEGWTLTPAAEWASPYRSMRQFVAVARNTGLVAALAPNGQLRDRAARIDSDLFVAQLQNIIDPARYRAAVCRDAALRPHDGTLIAQLSSNFLAGHTVVGLYRQWRAARQCADGFALWYGHGIGIPDQELVDIAAQFLDRVASSE